MPFGCCSVELPLEPVLLPELEPLVSLEEPVPALPDDEPLPIEPLEPEEEPLVSEDEPLLPEEPERLEPLGMTSICVTSADSPVPEKLART